AVMHAIDRAATGIGCDSREKRGIHDPEPDFLAFHVSAWLTGRGGALNPHVGKNRIAALFEVVSHESPDQEHERKSREDGPALPGVLHHLSEGIGHRTGDYENQEHLKKITERIRALKGMAGIRVEESAAIGSQLFDDFLR